MASGDEFLASASANNRFLGEENGWIEGEGPVRNSTKPTAKIRLALQDVQFACHTFVSVLSSIMRAAHTTRTDPAGAFSLLQAYRGAFRQICCDCGCDDVMTYVHPQIL